MTDKQKTRVQAWLALAAIIAAMDVTTYIVAPQDAWNPLHPHAANWINPKTVYGP